MNLEWIKSIPGYINYFNEDHQLIISLIGIDNYFKLYSYFGKTGIYFPERQYTDGGPACNDRQIIIELVGEQNYQKLYDNFGKANIYFSSSSILQLKKAWAIINRNVDYNLAARTLDVAPKSIYRWRQEIIINSEG